jgi:pilus assembly protein CpaF
MDIAVQRAAIATQLWGMVQQVLFIVQEDDAAQRAAGSFVLTRNLDVDAAQLAELKGILWPQLLDRPEFGRLSPEYLAGVVELAYDELIGVSVVGPFWRDDGVTEILIDGWDSISIEREGRLLRTPLAFQDLDHAQTVARQLALKVSDRALNPRTPLVTAELPGARVTFAIDSVVKSGISVSMRKFPKLMQMDQLLGFRALTGQMRDFLADCVQARANILVSGGTGTGKTTFINALSEFIPDSERVITIEDAYELSLRNTHWVALQTKEAASADDEVRIDLADLLVSTLRMRPDRVIVGEIREPKAAAVMLQAANTGHDGTMTTVHANSASRALNFRMAGMVRTEANMPNEVAAAEVASAIDVVVQVVRSQGRRFVTEVAVVDIDDVDSGVIRPRPVFAGELVADATGIQPVFRQVGAVGADTVLAMKLRDAGLHHRWVA